MSSLSVVSTLNTMRIGFIVSAWFDFHLKLFPSEFSFSICSLVDCGIVPVCILLHFVVSQLCFGVLFFVGCTNALICFYVSTKFSFWGTKLKSLIKFSLSSSHRNVSPRASLIFYHFFGKSESVDRNRHGHVRSSLYPSLLHSFSHVFIWFFGSCPWVNVGI